MGTDALAAGGSVGPRNGKQNGFFSLKTISSYLRIVSSGASSVASTVRSAGASVASSIADHYDDSGRDLVHWAGFDKLECEGDALRQTLLLGYRSGFQVWDVEEADDVRILASRHDGPVSFLQILKNPVTSKKPEDKFSDARPLLAVAKDGSCGGYNTMDSITGLSSGNGTSSIGQELTNENILSTSIHFYSLRTHDYVHELKFRSAVYAVRCSPRVIAVSQASQIHCFNAATLEREYTILTYPVVSGSLSSGGIGYGPLAVGPRWLSYSGYAIDASSTVCVSPKHLTNHAGLPNSFSHGAAQYAKESSKQIAAGIVTLGDMGYKKLTNSLRQGSSISKANSNINGQLSDTENAGMVIVRDIVSKSLVVQFRAHTSPISALCFDPSGTLLVTASVHGHNINVFQVMPPVSGISGSYVHLYRLQRGITNAVIQDVSFSDDSQWIMISSSRGTSHLFAIEGGTNMLMNDVATKANAYASDLVAKTSVQWSHGSGSSKNLQPNLPSFGLPITLIAARRIRNGSNGWKGAVSGAAVTATGRANPLSGAVASAFHNRKGLNLYQDNSHQKAKYCLLVFSPSGCMIQYVLRQSTGSDSGFDFTRPSSMSHVTSTEAETRLVTEALQKWDICHKRSRRDRSDSVDVYGEHGHGESSKLFQKVTRKGTSIYPSDSNTYSKVNSKVEGYYQLYISEVELKMHSEGLPLWTKSQFCFQVMLDDKMKAFNDAMEGETEIERIPTRTIEIRSKDLIPVFDYLHLPTFQQPRANAFESKQNEPSFLQRSGLLEDERHSDRSSCYSVDCTTVSAVGGIPNGTDENGWCSQTSLEAHRAFVNSREHTGSSL